MQTTTATATSILIEIKSTGEKIKFPSNFEAVNFLVDCELLPDKWRDTRSPFLALNEAVSNGTINVVVNPEEEESRPKLELKPTPPPAAPAPKLEFSEYTEVKEEIRPEPKEQPKVKPQPKVEPKKDPAALLQLLGEFITPGPATLDPEQVREIIREELSKQEPRIINHVFNINGVETKTEGPQHENFPLLVNLCALRLNVWLYGPAGSGKTHAAEQAAKVLNLPFACLSVCSQSTKTDLLGYQDATGRYIETSFYQTFKNGGVFLLDEIDNGNPNILNVLNAALSNGVCQFPGELVKRNPDFICIAGANTIGTGGNLTYSGRNRLDGAGIDRFKFLQWSYDEKMELEFSPVPEFTKKVQALRAKASKLGISCIVSPRTSIDGGKMILAGIDEKTALELCLFNKLDKEAAKLLSA